MLFGKLPFRNMLFKNFLKKNLNSILFLLLLFFSFLGQATLPLDKSLIYNPGPDPETESGKEVINLYAELPEYMAYSDSIMDNQKFRYTFGLMMTRTRFEKNHVKILAIGQDATHIAEASKQPGTSGFGGRVQSIGNFFGVDQSLSTTNAFFSTIKGQYGAFNHIYIDLKDEKPTLKNATYVDNELWEIANGNESEIRKKREMFFEWMIKNNPDSLRMILLFGGAAQDAFGKFLVSHGAKVKTRFAQEDLKYIRVPETELKPAGGNNEFAVPIDKDGNDIYQILVGRELDYSLPADQELAISTLKENLQKALSLMIFTGGGLEGSGMVDPAQLGGYDLKNVEINGVKTDSLKGLKLSDGTVITNDIAFSLSPHPTALSKMTNELASKTLKQSFMHLNSLKEKGWRIEPDLDENGKPMVNQWDLGTDYKYSRSDVGPSYFEFGAPDDRRASYADATRIGSQKIVINSRNKTDFKSSDETNKKIEMALKSKPSEAKDENDLWSVRPRQISTRFLFDRGPGYDIAELALTHLNREEIFAPKPGMKVLNAKNEDVTFKTHGISAYNVKTDPETGFFGFHRGDFAHAKALILADPQGLDDWNTSRAMTGARGQYLNGLMNDLGYGSDYLVIKTVPFGMDGADANEWEVVRKQTEEYREALIQKALENKQIEVIFTDGVVAQEEMNRILLKFKVTHLKLVSIQRAENGPMDSGIREAGFALGKAVTGLAKDIPRVHLPWWSRTWEGTGAVDFVIDSEGKNKGKVRLLIAPNWVAYQKVHVSKKVMESINKIKTEFENLRIRADKMPISEWLLQFHLDGHLELLR